MRFSAKTTHHGIAQPVPIGDRFAKTLSSSILGNNFNRSFPCDRLISGEYDKFSKTGDRLIWADFPTGQSARVFGSSSGSGDMAPVTGYHVPDDD